MKTNFAKIHSKLTMRSVQAILLIANILLIAAFIAAAYFIRRRPVETTSLMLRDQQTVCVDGDFYLPYLYDQLSPDFYLTFERKTTLFGKYDIYAGEVCFIPKHLLAPAREYSVGLQLSKYLKNTQFVTIKHADFPEVELVTDTDAEINALKPFEFTAKRPSDLFAYELSVSERKTSDSDSKENELEKDSVDCVVNDLAASPQILCSLHDLNLKLDSEYGFSLNRKLHHSYKNLPEFADFEQELITGFFKTANAINIVETSIAPDSVVLSPQPTVEIKLSEAIEKFDGVELAKKIPESASDVKHTTPKIETVLSDDHTTLTVKVLEPLQTSTQYELFIKTLESSDGSYLPKPYVLAFRTADPPKIISSNVKAKGFNVWDNVIVNFSSPLAGTQSASKNVTISPAVDFGVYINGSRVSVIPKQNFAACTTYTVKIPAGFKDIYGRVSTTGANYSFKTSCQRIASIGTSVQGRAISAYYFGTGPKKVVFYGAMHGNEANTRALLYSFINNLETRFDEIPKDKTIIVVPALNPDGVASGSRLNANGVDINRNFATASWRSDASYPGGNNVEGSGGTEPFSEPETRAIRDLILREGPVLVISYHSAANIVISNGAGIANSQGSAYAGLSGYAYVADSDAEGEFSYSVTGSFGEWSASIGRPALIVELGTLWSSEYSRNIDAMWDAVK